MSQDAKEEHDGMSSELETAISAAKAALRKNGQNDLPLGYRQAIWKALGERVTGKSDRRTAGHLRRGHLAILAAEHVLPIWDKRRPEDLFPRELLDRARATLDGKVDARSALREAREAWSKMDNLGAQENTEDLVLVGLAATQALAAAARDELFDPDKIDVQLTDSDVDPDQTDASRNAADAYAYVAGRDEPDRDKLKEFWEWWLRDAVPDAWRFAA